MKDVFKRIAVYQTGRNSGELAELAGKLWKEQFLQWPLLRENNKNLKQIELKKIEIDGFHVFAQFNPHRIKSSAAKVDAESLKKRKCFLCPSNLPVEQKGVLYQERYLILANPYPIFNRHLTIPSIEHAPQMIQGNMDIFLDLVKDLSPDFTVFYNGPKCGASAPDHFHFQACERNIMPIEYDFLKRKNDFTKKMLSGSNTGVYIMNQYSRTGFYVISRAKEEILASMYKVFHHWEKKEDETEPMLNLIGFFENNEWHLIFFPRKEHRPKQFFLEGRDKILLSPASVDMGGIFITPLREDYDRMNKELVLDIYNQVCQPEEFTMNIFKKMCKFR